MKQAILTHFAPAPIGPYSQAIRAGQTVYISGQIPIDPATGELVTTDIEAQTHQVMRNLRAILVEAGLSFSHVVSCTVFVKDMGMFARINAVYATYFEGVVPPARALVQVSDLPRQVDIEIAAIAHQD